MPRIPRIPRIQRIARIQRIPRILRIMALAVLVVFGLASPALAGSLPSLAQHIGAELDAQLVERLGLGEGPAKDYAIVLTTPVNINNLELASALARQLQEELAAWFAQAGYKIQEIRKGKSVRMDPLKGELLLSRKTDHVDQRNVKATLLLAGTYAATSRHVRFNIRLIHAASNDVLAAFSGTIPVTSETLELMDDGGGTDYLSVRPTVSTKFPPPRPVAQP